MNTHEEESISRTTLSRRVRRPYWMLLVVVVLGLGTVRASAVDRDSYIGNWVNVDAQTRGIKAIQIGVQDGQFQMRAWGACHPNPCKWGQANVSFLAPNVSSQDVASATAVYRPGFSIQRLTMRLDASGILEVEVMTHFTDNSGRSDYVETNRFRRVSWSEWNSNSYN